MVTVPSMTLGRADAILNSSFAQVYILQESFWLEAKELISPGNTRRWLIKMSSRRLFEWGRKEQRKEERKDNLALAVLHPTATLPWKYPILTFLFSSSGLSHSFVGQRPSNETQNHTIFHSNTYGSKHWIHSRQYSTPCYRQAPPIVWDTSTPGRSTNASPVPFPGSHNTLLRKKL